MRSSTTSAAWMAAAVLLAGAATTWAGSPDLAAHDYALHCAGCHGFDGSGSPQVPSLASMPRYLEVPAGRAYLVRVPGVAQAPLSDDRLAELLTWLVGRFGGKPLKEPFATDEVATLRARPLLDPVALRRRLLAELSDVEATPAR